MLRIGKKIKKKHMENLYMWKVTFPSHIHCQGPLSLTHHLMSASQSESSSWSFHELVPTLISFPKIHAYVL